MGYLSQKKRRENIREILGVSLSVLGTCCFILLFFKRCFIASFISRWLFQLYIYALIVAIIGIVNRVYWRGIGLLVCAFILYFSIGMGSNLFTDIKTPGLQSLSIFYQPDIKNFADTNRQLEKHSVDVAALAHRPFANIAFLRVMEPIKESPETQRLIVSSHETIRSGEILLSENNRAVFAEIHININKIVFISLDFSKTTRKEQKTALKNLAEFINMQDAPIVIVGNFGQEAWTPDFLTFLEKTGLEVKNSLLLYNSRHKFNPFSVPTINVLAYKDFGIRKLSFLPSKHNSSKPLLIELNY